MELTRIEGWLSGFDGFAGFRWGRDCLPHQPNMVTLLPKGTQVEDTITDVLGNWKKTLEFTCTLAFSGTGEAQTLWDLQRWVMGEDAKGTCPQLGQGRKSVRLEKGRHLTKNKLGLDIYSAQLTLTYEIYYEVNENGEN